MKAAAGLRQQFLLRDDVVFLNHGSFGACPRPVLDTYQKLQRELESEPVDFLHEERDLPGRMRAARAELARFLGARRDDLVFVPNATTGLNVVAHAVPLQRDDEVVATDHEYGAMDRLWTFVCEQRGARYVRAHVPLPLEAADQVVEAVWSQVSERTRVLFLSHLTSTTALILPVAELIRRAHAAGITTVIDGAHAPGQIDVDLDALGADFYVGNCHKWLMAPKGVGFLHATVRAQQMLKPLIVSWGWRSDHPSESRFIDEHEWTGTRDPSACLSVPAALEFRRAHDWPRVQRSCRELVQHARRGMSRLTNMPPICPDDADWFVQMHTLPVPLCDRARLQKALRIDHQIEMPVVEWRGKQYVRISCQGYNSSADVEAFLAAMATILREGRVFAGRS